MSCKLTLILSFTSTLTLAGCASSPWHDNLMSNQQVVAADCQQLKDELNKINDNANHLSETGTNTGIGAIFLTVLEAVAASGSGSTLDSNKSAGVNTAGAADEYNRQANELKQRKYMVEQVSSKKGCT